MLKLFQPDHSLEDLKYCYLAGSDLNLASDQCDSWTLRAENWFITRAQLKLTKVRTISAIALILMVIKTRLPLLLPRLAFWLHFVGNNFK